MEERDTALEREPLALAELLLADTERAKRPRGRDVPSGRDVPERNAYEQGGAKVVSNTGYHLSRAET